MELTAADYERILGEFRPRLGNYNWMWKLLRARATKYGTFPPTTWGYLKRFGNPRRPYFIGKTSEGIAFLGDYRDRYAATCAFDPDFDGPTIRFLQSRMQSGVGSYLDIGTNMGIVAAAMGRYLAGREEVLAFEPIAETARRAAATFALNNLTNVRLFPIAIGDTDGEITFYDAPGVSEGASANPTDHGDLIKWRKISVMCRRLDSLMEEGVITDAALLKIDTEGNELKTIQGAQKFLKRDNPALFFEYFPHVARSSGWTLPQMESAISSSGDYRFHVVHCHALRDHNALTEFPPDPDRDEIVDIYCEKPAAAVRVDEKTAVSA